MDKLIRTRVVALLVLSLVAGCAGPRSNAPSPATLAANKTVASFEKLLAAGRGTEVLNGIEARLAETRDPQLRARLEVLRGRAWLVESRPRSAILAFQRAEREARPLTPEVQLQSLQGQGDAQMALSQWRPAIQLYSKALKVPGLTTRQKDDLAYSAYIAAQQSGDTSTSAWRGRIRGFSEDRVAALSRSLLRLPETPPAPVVARAPAATPGRIPDDPQLILKEIHRRGEWGARPISGAYDPMKPITRITVHHSAEATAAASMAVVGSELRTLQASHQNKWADLGYHFLIDPTGGIWEGRALKWQGAHEGAGMNQGAIGICLMGNFEVQPLPAAQTAALARLLESLCRHFGVDAAHLKTHREVRPEPTDCPGGALQQWMDSFRRSYAGRTVARQ